jgi:hypothetical protein
VQILTHPSDAFGNQKMLVHRVSDCCEDNCRPSHVLLDGNDYTHDDTVLDEFRDYAFHWCRDRPRDRVPVHVLDLMRDNLCSTLVWLSRKALEEKEEILFVWIVAHEFRHVCQTTKNMSFDDLRNKSRQLRNAEFRNLPSSPLGVAELDADLSAMQTARSIFGVELLTEFLQRRPLPRCPYPEYTLFLQRLEVACRDNEKQR